jgi:hypothetical protein
MNFLNIEVPMNIIMKSGFLRHLYMSKGVNPGITYVFYERDITVQVKALLNKLIDKQTYDRSDPDISIAWEFLCM